MKFAAIFATGLLFGLGLTISGMMNPAKVLNFFDIFGKWDPSLAFVMAGGLIVTFVGYRRIFRRPNPIFADRFMLPTQRQIDKRLLAGSTLFGLGWGLVGLCPGASIPGLALGNLDVIYFFGALIIGLAATTYWDARSHLLQKTDRTY